MDDDKAKSFTDEYVHMVLSSSAEIHDYFVYQRQGDKLGVIYYCSKDGQVWQRMEDDDDFAFSCIEYLQRSGVPFFTDVEHLLQYETKMKAKYAR